MKISENFTLEELTRSDTAKAYNLDNSPNTNQLQNMVALVKNVLQPLRNQFGRVVINSCFRSPEVNKLVSGNPKSQHLTGEAADIRTKNYAQAKEWFEWIRHNLLYDQLIIEKYSKSSTTYWIHVSFSRCSNRQETIPLLIKNKNL